ncbi:MAG: glycosyltransferase, partial [Pyrinomonadaceae bacterium]
MKKRILIFSDYYQPSFTSGGAPQMVLNIVNRFFDKYDFFVVTRNYDSKSNKKPFSNIQTDDWNQTGHAQVFYCSRRRLNLKTFAEVFREVDPDLVLLNSAFSTPSIIFLILRKRKIFREVAVILAPCGSLLAGSLSVKPVKKWSFLKCARAVGLFDNVIWKASFPQEMDAVKKLIGTDAIIKVAPDLSPKLNFAKYRPSEAVQKEPGSVKFVYFSRIDRNKNLHYFLERLKTVNDGNIDLEVIGPFEDRTYWRECLKIMDTLPSNISVTVTGGLPQAAALCHVARNHFFVLPTFSENFGYVLMESLALGCPNLTSDNTVWSE